MKRKSLSDRAVRKALLQAHAQIERYDVARGVHHVQEAISPRTLLAQLLPGFGGSGSGSGSSFARAGNQLLSWYRRYPAFASSAAWFLGRVGRDKTIQVIGLVLALRKVLSLTRRRR